MPFQIGAWKVVRWSSERVFLYLEWWNIFQLAEEKQGVDESNYAEYLIRSSRGLFQQYEIFYINIIPSKINTSVQYLSSRNNYLLHSMGCSVNLMHPVL